MDRRPWKTRYVIHKAHVDTAYLGAKDLVLTPLGLQ